MRLNFLNLEQYQIINMQGNPLKLPEQLEFTNEAKQNDILFVNQTDQFAIFKIKSTDREALELRVFEGSILPKSQRSINVVIKNVDPARDKKLKLLVQWAYVSAEMRQKKIQAIPKDQLTSRQILIVERPSSLSQSTPIVEPRQQKEQRQQILLQVQKQPTTKPRPQSAVLEQTDTQQKIEEILQEKSELKRQIETVRTSIRSAQRVEEQGRVEVKKNSNAKIVIGLMLAAFLGAYFLVHLLGQL